MAGGQPLPIELVLEIMLYLYVDSREKPHRYFHNLSLVCKARILHCIRHKL